MKVNVSKALIECLFELKINILACQTFQSRKGMAHKSSGSLYILEQLKKSFHRYFTW